MPKVGLLFGYRYEKNFTKFTWAPLRVVKILIKYFFKYWMGEKHWILRKPEF